MKTIVGVYRDHDRVMRAVRQLKEKGFPIAHLFIIGPEGKKIVNRKMRTSPRKEVTVEGVLTGISLGAIVGILTGIGIIAIPGFRELYGAGAIIGALAGADVGLLGGGIATVLINYSRREKLAEKYEHEVEHGNNLLLASGTKQEIELAQVILASQEEHSYTETYRRRVPEELYDSSLAE